MNWQTLCVSCMQNDSGEPICPNCGAPFDLPPKNMLQLKPRTILREQYLMGRALGHGGFGVTYLAWDIGLESRLAVKEYLPNGVAGRASGETKVMAYSEHTQQEFDWGLDRFLDEARTLKKFNGQPGIVSVDTIFRENGTAYLVMEFLDGLTLEEFLKRRDGSITFETTLRIMLPVIDALSIVHAEGVLHRDISPDNIHLTRDGKVKLIDFGAARNALSQKSRNLSIILKEGYAPEEQYRASGIQGPWTDVYATAATMYHCVTGKIPQPALDRLAEDKVQAPSAMGIEIDPAAERALMTGMALKASERFQSMEDFKSVLTGSSSVTEILKKINQNPAPPPLPIGPVPPPVPSFGPPPVPPPSYRPPPPPPAPPQSQPGNARWLVPAALGLIAIIAIGVAVARRPKPPIHDDSTNTSTATSTTTSTHAPDDSTNTSTSTSTSTGTATSTGTSTSTSTSTGSPDTDTNDHSDPKKNTSPPDTKAPDTEAPKKTTRRSTQTQRDTGTASSGQPDTQPPVDSDPIHTPPSATAAYDTWIQEAKTAWSQQRFDQVQSLLNKAVQLNPNRPRAYSGLAELQLYVFGDANSAATNANNAISRGGEAVFHLRHDRSGDTFTAAEPGNLYISQSSVRYAPEGVGGGFTVKRSDIREVRKNRMNFIGGIGRGKIDVHPFHIRLANGQNYNLAPTSRVAEAERELIISLLGEK